jgi:hypothetical protein
MREMNGSRSVEGANTTAVETATPVGAAALDAAAPGSPGAAELAEIGPPCEEDGRDAAAGAGFADGAAPDEDDTETGDAPPRASAAGSGAEGAPPAGEGRGSAEAVITPSDAELAPTAEGAAAAEAFVLTAGGTMACEFGAAARGFGAAMGDASPAKILDVPRPPSPDSGFLWMVFLQLKNMSAGRARATVSSSQLSIPVSDFIAGGSSSGSPSRSP